MGRAAPGDLYALVFDGDRLVGVVSPSDVAQRLQLGPRERPQSGVA